MRTVQREDRQAYAAARIAGLKTALRLTEEQQKHWPAVQSAIRNAIRHRAKRRYEVLRARSQEKKSNQPVDIAARLQARAKGLRASAARSEQFAKAAGPLLASLDDGQKRRFGALLRRASRRRARARRRARVVRAIRRWAAK
jgi:zinc resistance-associated protein